MLWIFMIAACTGGDTSSTDDTSTVNGDCSEEERRQHNGVCPSDDTGTDPSEATGSFTAPMVDAGTATESCTSNLLSDNDDYIVTSGETKEVRATAYDLTFGDMALASEYSDFLPIHTAGGGGQWIAPSQTLVVGEGKTVTADTPVMSWYLGGQTWTCNDTNSTDESLHATFEMSYFEEDGQLKLEFDGSSMFITVDEVWYQDADCDNEGRFLSPSQLTYTVNCSWSQFSRQCWEGQLADRPASW